MTEKNSNHWQIITVDNFKLPSAPTATIVQQRWKRVLRLFGLQNRELEEERKGYIELPANKSLNLKPAVSALDEHLREWKEKKEPTVCFLLDPPFSGVDSIARDWAKKYK